jgi:hypothetical protein
MKTIKTVGVKTLKNNLSAYLKEAQSGTLVLVADRDRVIAEIRRPSVETFPGEAVELKAEWIANGILTAGKKRKHMLPASSVALPAGTSQRLLDEERGE